MTKSNKEMEEFKAKLKEMSVNELKEFEQELIKEAEKNDKKIAKLEFELPGTLDEMSDIADKIIRYVLDEHTVNWQYTLSVVELYDFWMHVNNNTKKKINYYYLDSTIRIMNGLQFKGYDACKAMVDINKYLTPLKDEYVKAYNSIYTYAEKHNMLMQEFDLRVPFDNQEQQ